MSASNSVEFIRIRRRADFVALNQRKRRAARSFALLSRRTDRPGPSHYGFTVTRKVGNAVERNRIRRRLKEAVRAALLQNAPCGHDFVLIARRAALNVDFEELCHEVKGALSQAARRNQGPKQVSRAN